MVRIDFQSPIVKAWAKKALNDNKVSANEAKELKNAVSKDGKIDVNESGDIAAILSSPKLEISEGEETLVKAMFIGNLQTRPGFIPEWQGDQLPKNLDTIKIRKVRQGIFEVDIGEKLEFLNPEYAIDRNGNIIIDYYSLYQIDRTHIIDGLYNSFLNSCDLTEQEEAGVIHFYSLNIPKSERSSKNRISSVAMLLDWKE